MADDIQLLVPTTQRGWVDLYLACDTPEERDGFLQWVGEQPGDDSTALLLSMMNGDEDPVVRVGAARSLALRAHPQGLAYLRDVLPVCSDDPLFAEVVQALVEVAGAEAFDELAIIFADSEREWAERQIAQAGLVRADLARAATLFVHLLESEHASSLPLESLMMMLPALVTEISLAPRTLAALDRLAVQADKSATTAVPRTGEPEITFEQECELDRADEAQERATVLREMAETIVEARNDAP